jgi:hypothetical protein
MRAPSPNHGTEASGHLVRDSPAIEHQLSRNQPSASYTHPYQPTQVTMQSLPDARSQSFEELYGPPENFLEIEVGLPEAPLP